MGLKSKKLNDNQSYKKSLQNAIDCAVPFTDDVFKASENSLFKERSFLAEVNATGKIVWKRPGEITKDPHLVYREKVRTIICYYFAKLVSLCSIRLLVYALTNT